MSKPKYWAGFLDGKLDTRDVDTGWGGFGEDGFRVMPAIFTSRKTARQQYEDVREVQINEVAKSKQPAR